MDVRINLFLKALQRESLHICLICYMGHTNPPGRSKEKDLEGLTALVVAPVLKLILIPWMDSLHSVQQTALSYGKFCKFCVRN